MKRMRQEKVYNYLVSGDFLMRELYKPHGIYARDRVRMRCYRGFLKDDGRYLSSKKYPNLGAVSR